MLEIINIIYFFLIFLIIFSLPFNKFTTNNIVLLKNSNFNFFDFQLINIIFFCYVMLIVSFLNFDLKFVFYAYILIGLVYFFTQNSKKFNFNKIKDKKYFFFFSLITISIFIYIGHNLKLEWDGHHWLEKAVFFYNENKIENFYKLKSHPEYPHLGAYIWALFWKNSFINHEYTGRLFCIYFFIVSVFSLSNYLDKKLEKYKIFIIIFLVVILFEPYLLAGYQDYFLFSILILSSRLIFILDFDKINLNLLNLIIITLGLLIWFKDEGLIYFLIFSFFLISMINLTLKNKLIYFSFIFMIVFLNYLSQKYLMGVYDLPSTTFNDGNILEVKKIFSNLDIFLTKSFKLFIHIGVAFLKYLAWILILLSILYHYFNKEKFDIKVKYFLYCLILNLIFLYSAFMSFKAFDWMLSVALDRLLFQISGFYLILFIFLLNKAKIYR